MPEEHPIKDPEIRTLSDRIGILVKKRSENREFEEFQKEILKKPQPPEQLIMAFIPHQMAKTSIFFPMSKKDLKEENRKISKIEHKTPWGKIVIEGIKLSITEEDIFLAIMKIADKKIQDIRGRYVLETNMKEIVHLLYGRSGYTALSYKRIEEALNHFQLVRFALITGHWKKKGKERIKEENVRSIGNIIQSYKYNKNTKDLIITFNPEFLLYFLESMLTKINYTLRRKLKKDGSKALLRFLSTHNNPDQMHILTVLNAINYNTDQPLYELRRKLKGYISELKQNGVLGPKTRISNDIVYFDVLLAKKWLSAQ